MLIRREKWSFKWKIVVLKYAWARWKNTTPKRYKKEPERIKFLEFSWRWNHYSVCVISFYEFIAVKPEQSIRKWNEKKTYEWKEHISEMFIHGTFVCETNEITKKKNLWLKLPKNVLPIRNKINRVRMKYTTCFCFVCL